MIAHVHMLSKDGTGALCCRPARTPAALARDLFYQLFGYHAACATDLVTCPRCLKLEPPVWRNP